MRLTRGIWKGVAAIGLTLAAGAPARAFYWPEWPGSQLRVKETLLEPKNENPANPPQTTTEFGPTPTDRTDVPPVPVGPPADTPEPATAAIALLGVGAVAARRWWKSERGA